MSNGIGDAALCRPATSSLGISLSRAPEEFCRGRVLAAACDCYTRPRRQLNRNAGVRSVSRRAICLRLLIVVMRWRAALLSVSVSADILLYTPNLVAESEVASFLHVLRYLQGEVEFLRRAVDCSAEGDGGSYRSSSSSGENRGTVLQTAPVSNVGAKFRVKNVLKKLLCLRPVWYWWSVRTAVSLRGPRGEAVDVVADLRDGAGEVLQQIAAPTLAARSAMDILDTRAIAPGPMLHSACSAVRAGEGEAFKCSG